MWSLSFNVGRHHHYPRSTVVTLLSIFFTSFIVNPVLGEENSLQIMPIGPECRLGNCTLTVPLGQPSVFTCAGKVDVPERLTDMRWWYPNGKPIEPSSTPLNRVEILPGEQPGQISLFFSTVQNEDLGTYKCTAMYANNRQLTTSFKLSTFVPITFEDAPTNQYAVKNEDYKVKCRVKADPSPSVDWKKDHKTINATDHYLPTSDGMLIKNVSEYDEGVYTCRVRVISLGKVEERHIQLEVQEKPRILAQQPPAEGVEAGSVFLQCSAAGKPEPEYEWVNHRGQDLSDLGRFVVDKYKGTLQIDDLKREDTGMYRCTARNTAGFVTMSAHLNVVTKPIIEEFKNVTAQVDGSALLTCRARGDPAPDIRFHKDSKMEPFTHGPQRDTRIYTDQRKDGSVTIATIKIDNLLRTDDGLYNCIAQNALNSKTELLGHLTIEFPPSFANTPVKEAWSWDAKPANITCLAEAIPNATISWYFMANPEILVINNPPEIQIFGMQSQSSLQVIPFNRERYGWYNCIATNKLGTAQHRIQLKEARKPGSILQVITHGLTATSVAFKIVGPTDDGGLPIQRFVAQYKEGNSYQWNEAKLVQWPVDQQIFTVENLEPLRQYQFRFAAENAVGVGDFAQERFEMMPKRSFPEAPKILGEDYQGFAINPYPDRFELRWQVPENNGERIDYFEISYVLVKNVSGVWTPYGSRQVEQKSLGEPRHVLRNLSPGTYYKVEIRAHNIIGNSPPSTIIVRTTLPPSAGGTMGYEVAETLSDASIKMPILIAIVLAIVLVLLCILDIACCRMNKTGIMWTLTNKTCGKKRSPSLVNTTKSAICEKQPLNESIMDVRESLRPVGDSKNSHGIQHGKVLNGTKSEHPTVSSV